ncbi:MAG TPA: GIY-YIG nuclease family protein [Mesorhizobium sp.]|uniref:GIY-YIG nuclease family protein n=1 Tax=Mesorhizobium sp. TaxID=1871066 RepID=UPI002DDCD35B|nr:GIY-YIG nuclease family protein [Mesorhizobium sp.]HEV2504985.1 GIY-YIG nuclease family protein [Mesorhizobium sp.]
MAAYKKRDVPAGIYGLICAETNQRWVGYSPDLDAMPNRLWFTLRLGSHRAAALQAAYNQHGQDAIAIEVLELFEDDCQPEGAALKERLSFWRDKMDALPA